MHEADSAAVAGRPHDPPRAARLERDQRLPVLLDLTSAPGRTVVFTRTKHGAKALARQLNPGGVPAVELHGNLSQNARDPQHGRLPRRPGATLVATDIAARGIHVDDIALVIHADPPADHKAYLHRSGRTARAGNSGIVVTLMTGEQTREVRGLARAAGVQPTTTQLNSVADPVLATIAPGARVLREGLSPAARGVDGPGGAGGSRRRGGSAGSRSRSPQQGGRGRSGQRRSQPGTAATPARSHSSTKTGSRAAGGKRRSSG